MCDENAIKQRESKEERNEQKITSRNKYNHAQLLKNLTLRILIQKFNNNNNNNNNNNK